MNKKRDIDEVEEHVLSNIATKKAKEEADIMEEVLHKNIIDIAKRAKVTRPAFKSYPKAVSASRGVVPEEALTHIGDLPGEHQPTIGIKVTLPEGSSAGSSWTQTHLDQFGVTFHDCDFLQHWADNPPEIPTCVLPLIEDDRFWTDDVLGFDNEAWHDLLGMLEDQVARVWKLLFALKTDDATVESAVDDFVVALMQTFGFEQKNTFIRTRRDTDLFVCNKLTKATADACVLDTINRFYLCVVEDKSDQNHIDDPQAQGVAEAIAAVQHNRSLKSGVQGERVCDYTFMPFFTCSGTAFGFYLAYFTEEFLDCVEKGRQPPPGDTIILRHTFTLTPLKGFDFMLRSARKEIFSCFALLAEFLKDNE